MGKELRNTEVRRGEAALLHPARRCLPQGVTEAFWIVSGTFVCRKEYTWGQILLVSVPENVSNTPFFLKMKNKIGRWITQV